MDKDFKFEEELRLPSLRRGNISMIKIILTVILLCIFLVMWFLYSELYAAEAQNAVEVNFTVEKGESIDDLAERLGEEQIIRNVWLFKKYLIIKEIDKKVQAGNFKVIYPITLSRVANALKIAVSQNEKTITIIPGWDLRDLADYLKDKELLQDEEELFAALGKPAILYKGENKPPKLDYKFKLLEYKPDNVSFEGYLAPETYRIFNNAKLGDVIEKLLFQQSGLFTEKMYEDIEENGRTVHEILTMASILESEVRTADDKAAVADITMNASLITCRYRTYLQIKRIDGPALRPVI